MSDVLKIFKKLEYHVKIKSICHHQMSEFYKKILYYIEYPCVILSFISSSTIILELFQKSNIYDLIILNIFTFVMVLIANITKLLKISQKMEDHCFYSKEFSKIYRNIMNFYDYVDEYNNYKTNMNISDIEYNMMNKISDFHFNKFVSQIQNQIFYLSEDEPKIWKFVIKNVHNREHDTYFYFIQTRNKNNKYTINQLIYICSLDENQLYEVVKYILFNSKYQINNNGSYRYIEMQKFNKKVLLNYIILEKNISFENIYKIVISCIEEPIEFELHSISIDVDVNSLNSF